MNTSSSRNMHLLFDSYCDEKEVLPVDNEEWSHELVFCSINEESKRAYNVIFMRVRVTNVAMGKYTSSDRVSVALGGGADKSLSRPTSRCRRTESIVSLERGMCSCAELQVFLVTEAERKHVRRRATISTSRRELSSSFLSARQGAEGNSHHFERNNRGTFANVCHPQKLGDPV